MARPILVRTVRTYQRDVEHLGRLRTALRLDTTIDPAIADRAAKLIDKLTLELGRLADSL